MATTTTTTPPAAAAAAAAAAAGGDDAAAADSQLAHLRKLDAELQAQKALVSKLKADGKEKGDAELIAAVSVLKRLVTEHKALTKAVAASTAEVERLDVNRAAAETLLKRRFFFAPSFELYGGVAGLYDFGPPGCAVKANVVALWRQHFVLGEDLLEVDCPAVTAERVLEASGHVANFFDFMVRELDANGNECGEYHRADHLLEAAMEARLERGDLSDAERKEAHYYAAMADDFDQAQLAEALTKFDVRSPSGAAIGPPAGFNVMFATQVGPSAQSRAFLRPETAQGIFTNFKRLLDYNNTHMPFGAAQIGVAYRNEISPKQGLLRVREFTLAEIEYFVLPDADTQPPARFAEVADVTVRLLTAEQQLTDRKLLETTVGAALRDGVLRSPTLAYWLGRVQQFYERVGARRDALRFRQHKKNEMAHYAADCWDGEMLTSYGWIEVNGIADRAAFDLDCHAEASKQPLQVYVRYDDGPRTVEAMRVKMNKGKLGKALRGDAKGVMGYLGELPNSEAGVARCRELEAALEADGKVSISCSWVDVKKDKKTGEESSTPKSGTFELTRDVVSFEPYEKRVHGENVTPKVIEPSFGIGRILYCLFEQAFRARGGDDEQRNYLALKPAVAPVKVSILPLLRKPDLTQFVPQLRELFREHGVSCVVDGTGDAIGRRYARTDEIGIPFGVTIDYDTVADQTVTLRERDSMAQIRVPIAELGALVVALADESRTWQSAYEQYPHHAAAAADAAAAAAATAADTGKGK